MHNTGIRENTQNDEGNNKDYKDYLATYLPALNVVFFIGINTAGASLGCALTNTIMPNSTPSNIEIALQNAALSSFIGFTFISAAYTLLSKPNNTNTAHERLIDSANAFFPLSAANMTLSSTLPFLSSFYIYNQGLSDSIKIGVATGIGATAITFALLITAICIQLGEKCKPSATQHDETLRAKMRQIIHEELQAQQEKQKKTNNLNPLRHTIVPMHTANSNTSLASDLDRFSPKASYQTPCPSPA